MDRKLLREAWLSIKGRGILAELGFGGQGPGLVKRRAQRSLTTVWSTESLSVDARVSLRCAVLARSRLHAAGVSG